MAEFDFTWCASRLANHFDDKTRESFQFSRDLRSFSEEFNFDETKRKTSNQLGSVRSLRNAVCGGGSVDHGNASYFV